MDTEKTFYRRLKYRINRVLDQPAHDDPTAIVVHLLLALIILINTVVIILYTEQDIAEEYGHIFTLIINICLVIFFCEYVLRMWSCTNTKSPVHMVTDRIRYGMHVFLIIDLISIMPLFLPFLAPQNVALIRFVRLLSIFKLGRFTRYSDSLIQLVRVIRKKREIFVIMLFFLVFVLLFSATIMYMVEYEAQPHAFSSIPAALWWAVMTVTTVGYGDIIPITPVGRMIGGFVTICGVLILALPSAIMATGFIEERYRHQKHALSSHDLEASIGLLERLVILKDAGEISEEEFLALKAALLESNRDS